jgi:hypothetical protein
MELIDKILIGWLQPACEAAVRMLLLRLGYARD